MKTEFLRITGRPEEDDEVIRRAAEVIRRGGLAAIPTETVYGLAGKEGLPGTEEPADALAGDQRTHTFHPRGGEQPREDEEEGLGQKEDKANHP